MDINRDGIISYLNKKKCVSLRNFVGSGKMKYVLIATNIVSIMEINGNINDNSKRISICTDCKQDFEYRYNKSTFKRLNKLIKKYPNMKNEINTFENQGFTYAINPFSKRKISRGGETWSKIRKLLLDKYTIKIEYLEWDWLKDDIWNRQLSNTGTIYAGHLLNIDQTKYKDETKNIAEQLSEKDKMIRKKIELRKKQFLEIESMGNEDHRTIQRILEIKKMKRIV